MKKQYHRIAVRSVVGIGLAALLSITASLQAQISVGVSGAPANPFTTTPLPAEWSTRDTTVGDAGTLTTPDTVDAAAQGIDGSTVTTALPTIGADGTARLARHNTAGEYLFTQP